MERSSLAALNRMHANSVLQHAKWMELRKTILDNEILNTLYSTKLLPDSIGQKTDRQNQLQS